MQDRYEALLVEEAGKLGARAFASLGPARLGSASGDAPIGINRREVDTDGSIFLGENPDGIVDHEVRVIRVDDREGKRIAVAFAHGCPTVTMGPKCLAYSPDFVGPARVLVEGTLGCPSLFLQANGGDINPRVGIGGMEDDSDNKNRTGWMLGGEVVKVASEIYTNTIRGPASDFRDALKGFSLPSGSHTARTQSRDSSPRGGHRPCRSMIFLASRRLAGWKPTAPPNSKSSGNRARRARC